MGIRENLLEKYRDQGLTDLYIHPERNGALELSRIEVSKESRSHGLGTKVMRELCFYADSLNLIIVLSVSEHKTGRLISWYRDLDFHLNKGRNKDFRFTNLMIRYPQGLTRSEWIKRFPNE